MSTNITLKRSSVQGKVPLVGDLALGEIALNTYDGKLFIKKNVGGSESIVEVAKGTDLSLTSNSSTVSINSDTGTDATILAANATTAGVLTADAQTIAGAKTFNSDIIAGSATMSLFDTTATTVNFAGAATTVNFGYDGNLSSTTNINTRVLSPTYTKTVNLGTGGGTSSITNINIGAGPAGATTISSPSIIVSGLADTATAATHYYVETSAGNILPKTLANVKTELVTAAAVSAAGAVMNTGNESIAGIKTFSNGTASTNTTSGSVVVTGGLGVSGTVTATGGSFTNLTLGGTAVTSTAAELNILDGVTSTTAELNILDGVIATTAELNFVDGVTSAIQTQLNAKQGLDAKLTALVDFNTVGIMTQTATDVFAGRTITAGTGITATNGNGVSGNPTIAITAGGVTATELASNAVTSAKIADDAVTATKIATGAVSVLIGTLTTTSGTTRTLTGLTLSDYRFLILVFRGVSITQSAIRDITVGTAIFARTGGNSADNIRGIATIALNDGTFVSNFFGDASSVGALGQVFVGTCGITTADTSVSVVATVSAVFDAGSILFYGVK
jgi:hypothetical protein